VDSKRHDEDPIYWKGRLNLDGLAMFELEGDLDIAVEPFLIAVESSQGLFRVDILTSRRVKLFELTSFIRHHGCQFLYLFRFAKRARLRAKVGWGEYELTHLQRGKASVNWLTLARVVIMRPSYHHKIK